MNLACGFVKPLERPLIILRDAVGVGISATQRDLRVDVSLLGRFTLKANRLFNVFWDAFASLVEATESHLRRCGTLIGGETIIMSGLRWIGRDTAPHLEQQCESELRLRVPE